MSVGYEPSLLAATQAAERDHFWYRARREIIVAAIRRAAPLLEDGSIVEMGCGNGAVLEALVDGFPRATVIGLERFAEGAAVARGRTGAPVAVCDIERAPLRRAADVVGSFDVIEHLDDDESGLRAMRDLLRPSGVLVVTVPAHPELWSAYDEASGHRRRYTASSLCSVLDRAGFDVRYITHFMSILYPAARLRRRRARQQSLDAAAVVAREFDVSRAVNAVLYRILRQEAHAVARHRRLPTGTSLLCEAVPR